MASSLRLVAVAALCSLALPRAVADGKAAWQREHDRLVARLATLRGREGDFGPSYRPLYAAALGWYAAWGGRNDAKVDDNMVSPEQYAAELADALEHGRNYFAENPGALFPLSFEKTLAGGRAARCNYWLSLPAGFPGAGRTFPLIIGLHGSGWLGHKISFVRGKGAGGATFSVTPIDEAGPWQIDFLNAYLGELESILPVDPDRVYLEGHSLGAMATWEWALSDPGRFAAISPRDGLGEPYRAVRLRNVPAWVVHGEKDDVIYPGYAEEMISALRACGGTAKYSLLPGAPHNIPADFDQASVVRWYLEHSRSHEPPAADPRDGLGLGADGASPWSLVPEPGGAYWTSGPVAAKGRRWGTLREEGALFRRIEDRGLLVDAPLCQEFGGDPATMTLWLALPAALAGAADPSAVRREPMRIARFYFRGTREEGLAHAAAIAPQLAAAGAAPSGKVWVTPLSLWQDSPRGIAEYGVELR